MKDAGVKTRDANRWVAVRRSNLAECRKLGWRRMSINKMIICSGEDLNSVIQGALLSSPTSDIWIEAVRW